jgi:acetyl esterase/lipase
MNHCMRNGIALAALAVCSTAVTAFAQQQPPPPVQDDGTITAPSFQLPFSSFASPEARDALVVRLRTPRPTITSIDDVRRLSDQGVQPDVDFYTARYPFTSTKSKIGNVPIETFEPAAGIAHENRHRVLIQIHGGGFNSGGGGVFGTLESIAIVGEARIKAIAVDYRLLPEHTLQDAVDDVLTVYREVLKSYRPWNIGIYGCSAGGSLTTMAVTAMIRQHLPLPGAIGVFCSPIRGISGGDSSQIFPRFGSVLSVVSPARPVGTPAPQDPFGPTQDEMRKFPSTLFLTGTRAPDMSAGVESNNTLRSLGVHSELVLFDGMDHGFFLFGANFPESTRANKFIAQFFLDNLGRGFWTKRNEDWDWD